MSVRLYADVHVPFAISVALRLRGVDMLTAQIDGTTQVDDSQLLARATTLGRVLFSQDTDLLRVTSEWLKRGTHFAGAVYAHQLRISIGQCVSDLELIATATDAEDWIDRVEFVPL